MDKRPGSSSKGEKACEGKIVNDADVLPILQKMFEEFKVSIHHEVNELKNQWNSCRINSTLSAKS